MLHPAERGYGLDFFGDDIHKVLCYTESRLAKNQTVATDVGDDEFLQNFLGDGPNPGFYDTYKNATLGVLLDAFVADATSENAKYVIIWFIREYLDTDGVLEMKDAGTRSNALTFYKCYPVVAKTIEKANAFVVEGWKEKFEALKTAEEALAVDKRVCMEYPSCFVDVLQ